jgi:hypothetical protein
MSRTGFAKNRQRGRDAMQHTPDIDVDHSIPLIHLQLVQQRKRHESGIADKDIKATESLLRSADECREIRTLGDINRHRFGLATIATDLGGESFESVEAARIPRSARCFAVASPIPLLAPVIAITLPSSPDILRSPRS